MAWAGWPSSIGRGTPPPGALVYQTLPPMTYAGRNDLDYLDALFAIAGGGRTAAEESVSSLFD